MTTLLGAPGSFAVSWVTYKLAYPAENGGFRLTAFLVGIIIAMLLIAVCVGVTGRRGHTSR